MKSEGRCATTATAAQQRAQQFTRFEAEYSQRAEHAFVHWRQVRNSALAATFLVSLLAFKHIVPDRLPKTVVRRVRRR